MNEKHEKALINAEELKELLDKGNIILIDARSGTDAHDRYLKAHLDHALHVDLDKDLATKTADPANGGRHPLPDIHAFGSFLGALGIGPSDQIVVYDDKNGANAAARFWWMLRSLGHQNIQVLNGGMIAAEKAGIQVISGEEKKHPGAPYPVSKWKDTVDIDEVAALRENPDYIIIDVREAYRYNGEREPLDKIAGHIPGAINIPYPENLDSNGTFLSAEELNKKYLSAINQISPDHVIVHCGSGVTACHTLLALEEAGIKGPRLYVGSWSEWSSAGREIAKGTGK